VPGQHFFRGGLDAGPIRRVDLHGVEAGVPGRDLVEQVGTPPADDDGVAGGLES
jgi:hypothetical protein